ncbi:MAG: hypothetical protein DRH12_00765 [Deltaproteobacteria bacterium]|nr:MAG: hypothetical protein DRH12_00765 [Deltaproteobacteria bacterium]RLB86240.1 MAG: hypothetical protein DRH15_02085 [Deltaproteobacteria bacterium]
MRKKGFGLLVVLLMGLLFLVVGVLCAADKGPDTICIQNTGYKADKKGPVTFSHKKHHDDYGIACTECHHNYQNGKNVWKEGDPVKHCKDCHNPLKKQGKVLKLQNAYHKNCKTCHKKLAKEGKKTGPYKKCSKCHAKKKKS